ncbi:sulfatase family protein [Tuwongella immobilis]|uniref:Sulfatase N-terminal domain-containing protein n=1 Tax=Tuwongella immobilis TaxID=692036 RepID=A0A6C2YSX8_9BACT|nr:sulfatase-like hydrolase/transferase [Tuwongella immobilis]VIP04838.1 arylsulfatase : Arylsulphatase A OS=Blastopirellula marina DSM 3645 GN=DSM3645_23501 PE=4 SV=1: Sulfatase [Tuwongella immobilis]VTS07036.1 arylsulfatase : Arylsulphatase A OS=Blastopirellula marina DSM 3645 GN=DSM3645_23501 PE=4 SV=1: Sulfatase [Tuwongella immobilis]
MIARLSLWLALLVVGITPTSIHAAKPNFVIVLCDDLGAGDLGCYGHPRIRTPNLDAMAKAGMKLEQCYAAAPVCSPSRAGMLTGRDPNRYGIRDWIPANSGIRLPPTETTIATLLKNAGYRTGLFGKWHLNSKMDGSEPMPVDHGFQQYFATQNNAAPSHENPTNFIRDGKPVGPLTGNSTSILVDESIRWLDTVGNDPFLLVITLHAPHEPVATPAKFTEPYADIEDATKRTYFGSVSLVDAEVGRLLAELDRRKLGESTLVWFTSDNGPETLNRYKAANHSHGTPGKLTGMKLHLTEGGIRVPGILRWTGTIPAGKISQEPISGIDLLPTLLELAGRPPMRDRFLDGVSVAPVILGKPFKRSQPLYWQYDRALGGWNVALRSGDYKLMADRTLSQFRLVNLATDPLEQTDLAATEPKVFADLKATLQTKHYQINLGAIRRKP